MVIRLAGAAAVLFALLGLSASPAFAKLVVDGTSVEASLADGVYTAKISLINTGDGDETVPEVVELTDECDAQVADRTIGSLRSGSVTLTFDEACFGDAESLTADLDGAGSMPAVTIKKPADAHEWLPMGIAAVIAAVAAIAVGLVSLRMVEKIDADRKARNDPNSEDGAERKVAYDEVRALVDAAVARLTPGAPLSWKLPLPEPADFTTTSEVKGLEAGWSFKDSWAANLTVATTAFVTLLSSADTLTAVLGEKPEEALGVMTVAGLISAVIVAVANTVAKLVGDSPSKVTVRGLILSTSLVVFAAAFQAVTVGGTALTLVDGWMGRLFVITVTIAVGVVLVWYALATTHSTLKAGAADPLPTLPPNAVEAWDATEPWQRAIVKHGILTTYADWLTTPAPPPAVTAYPATPMMVMATSWGDEVRQQKSLI